MALFKGFAHAFRNPETKSLAMAIVAFLCALLIQHSTKCQSVPQAVITRKLDLKKEMQGKCLSGLDLVFAVEKTC